MNTKGRNQFSHGHPNAGQRPKAESDIVEQKGEVAKQSTHRKFHDPFGAPHFPPSENLPPQAKRVAMAKKKKAEEHSKKEAEHAHSHAEMQDGEPQREQYPDALPRASDAKAAAGQTWSRMAEKAEPVLEEAKEHASGVREAASTLWSEAMELFRTPGVLFRLLLQARRA